jgi:1-acyl-sn-glycerol-3-phosphate acyltransferase
MRKAIVLINLVLSTVVLSIIALMVSPFDKRGDAVHNIARFCAMLHLKVCGIKVSVSGLNHIHNPPYIFMCNHQSALDIYGLLKGLPLPFKWVAKRQLFSIPFLGWAMKRAGYISLDRENPREALTAIEDAAKRIKNGVNIIIFPEGTRSNNRRLLPFKKGVFSLAVKAGVPVAPIGIKATGELQPKDHLLPKGTGTIYINIGRPVDIAKGARTSKAVLMNEVREAIEGLIS